VLSARCVFEVRSISEYYILHETNTRVVCILLLDTEHVKGLNAADARPTWRSAMPRRARRRVPSVPRDAAVRAGLLNRVAGTRSDKDIGAGALPQSAERGDLRLRAGSRAWIGDRASSYTYVVSKCSVLRLRGMGAT
jgi:hypothetical protein